MAQGNAHYLIYIVIKHIICNTYVSFQTGLKLKPSTNDRDRAVCHPFTKMLWVHFCSTKVRHGFDIDQLCVGGKR